MNGFGLMHLFAVFLIVIALVGWLGWRFFYTPPPPPPEAVNPPPPKPKPQPQPTPPPKPQVQPKSPGGEPPPKRRFRLSSQERQLLRMLPFLAIIPIGLVLLLRGRFSLEPLEANELEREKHIRTQLNPERLVPPPPLPPAFFINTERPELESADRDWSKLDGGFAQKVLRVLARLEKRGFSFVLLEAYRSPERQEMLAKKGPHVTRAGAFQSRHQYGLAVDLAPVRDGKLCISEKNPWAFEAYKALGEESIVEGFRWGGSWTMQDYGHVEVSGPVGAMLKTAP